MIPSYVGDAITVDLNFGLCRDCEQAAIPVSRPDSEYQGTPSESFHVAAVDTGRHGGRNALAGMYMEHTSQCVSEAVECRQDARERFRIRLGRNDRRFGESDGDDVLDSADFADGHAGR